MRNTGSGERKTGTGAGSKTREIALMGHHRERGAKLENWSGEYREQNTGSRERNTGSGKKNMGNCTNGPP